MDGGNLSVREFFGLGKKDVCPMCGENPCICPTDEPDENAHDLSRLTNG
jgi:hypothetical protein